MKWIWVLTAALTLIILFSACTNRPTLPYVELKSIEEPGNNSIPATRDKQGLRVALASITSARESVIYYDELLKYLGEEIDRPVELVQRKSYAEVNELLKDGQVDLAFVCTYAYVLARDQFGAELLAVPQLSGRTTYRSYIIARANKGISRFEQLRDKRFAFTDPLSTTGFLYPSFLVRQLGETPKSFFQSYLMTYSHDNSIRAVAESLVDGAAVDSQVFDYLAERNPQKTSRLTIIKESPEFSAPPVVTRPGLPIEIKQKLSKFFLTLDHTHRGQKILAQLGVDKFVSIDDSAYNAVRDLGNMVKTVEATK